MNIRPVIHLISYLLLVIAGAIGVCFLVAWYDGDPWPARRGFALSSGIVLVAGIVAWATTRGPVELSRRDGIGIVVFGWLAVTLLGSLPFMLCGVIDHPVDAIFESVSGFTTTGASVFRDVEQLPDSILFWRALTHFLGGMGILVLCVAIIPFLGVGGMQIYRAEMAGPTKDRLTPRIASTAKLLWGVYLLLNVLLIILLRSGGMPWFDSVCHSFATVATGGFSTKTASIAAYDSVYIESVVTVFMLLSGMNFALHFRALRGGPLAYPRDPEWRFYMALFAIASIGVAVNLIVVNGATAAGAFRDSLFTCASIMTTTGFATDDFARWPALSLGIIFLLMLAGGSAGSTAGGIKSIRLMALLKKMTREIKLFIQPQGVYQVKIGKQLLDADDVGNIFVFFFIFVLVFILATLVMTCFMPDMPSAMSAVAATLANVGPGFSSVGPTQAYDHVPGAAKAVLITCMLLGRLELYTLLVVLAPSFWRR